MPRFANTQALKLASVFSDDALLLAWARVAANGGTAGSDNQRIEDFGRDLLTEIPRLQTELLQGRHVLQPYLPVFIPKHDGSQRRLLIPSVRDRVAQTAATQALTPVFERGFEAPSFGYRAGHSVQSAINAVLALRDGGCTWVLDTDIDGFFDHVQHAVLQDRLTRHISDPDLLQLLIKWLTPSLQQVMGHNLPRTLTVGMAQGSPLSPLYANILLDELDEALMAQGFTHVRYADDFVVLANSQERVQAALMCSQAALDALQLRLKPVKTRLTPISSGFGFLGVWITGSGQHALDPRATPWLLGNSASTASPAAVARIAASVPVDTFDTELDDAHGDNRFAEDVGVRLLDEPELAPGEPHFRTLYVTQPGLSILKDAGRISVVKADAVQLRLPRANVDRVVIAHNALLSTALILACQAEGIDLFIDDAYGERGGYFAATNGALHALQTAQRRFAQDPAKVVATVGAMVKAKLHNQLTVAKRLLRSENDAQLSGIVNELTLQVRDARAQSVASWRGVEGNAARLYWAVVQAALPNDWKFTGRKHSPPPDAFNAMLSYAYTLLAHEVHSHAQRRGLALEEGLLHTAGASSASLVSDLMEEFRAPIADTVCLELARSGTVSISDFVFTPQGDRPVQMSDSARRLLIARMQARIASPLQHPRVAWKITWSRAIQFQAWHYARVMQGLDVSYLPLRLKG